MLSFKIVLNALILDPTTCSTFRSCLVLASHLALCPPFQFCVMPSFQTSPHAPHAVISFISCLVIFPLSVLMTCTSVSSQDMPTFQVWLHALLWDLALCPPLISWPLPSFHILLRALLQIMPHASIRSFLMPSFHILPHAILSDHASCLDKIFSNALLSYLTSCHPFRSCHSSFASKFLLLLSSFQILGSIFSYGWERCIFLCLPNHPVLLG